MLLKIGWSLFDRKIFTCETTLSVIEVDVRAWPLVDALKN